MNIDGFSRCGRSCIGGICCAVMMMFLVACEREVVERAPIDNTPPTFIGPDYMRGSIESMARVRGFEPMLVSGYGLVVNLDGTGSTGVPAYMRQYMINYARRMGIGSPRLMDLAERYPKLQQSAEGILADPDTAIVEVTALIPPGAVPGTRFDVMVQALDQTQTTSLIGGELWQTDLGIDGANPTLSFARTQATARGSIYSDPFDEELSSQQKYELARRAVVVGGGQAIERRRVQIVLNQPSWYRSAAIANRINERFPAGPNERIQTAQAQTDSVIEISVPRRFQDNPVELLELIGKLFIQGGPGFEERKAEQLAQALRDRPQAEHDIALAWKGLGRVIVPVLGRYYEDPELHVQMAALNAGSWLGDERTVNSLSEIAKSSNPELRLRVARMLANLANSRAAERALVRLLDDDDLDVRLAAYESLQSHHSTAFIERFPVRDAFGTKFLIDRVVPAEKPLIYITQDRLPKIVFFGPVAELPPSFYARIWDGRLMFRMHNDSPSIIQLFYQAKGNPSPKVFNIQASLETLTYVLGHTPTAEDPQQGLGLTYGHVVDAIYDLVQGGFIDTPIKVKANPLVDIIEESQETGVVVGRPEFSSNEAFFAPIDAARGEEIDVMYEESVEVEVDESGLQPLQLPEPGSAQWEQIMDSTDNYPILRPEFTDP